MAEFQNLAKLLEAIKLTETARDKLKDMQKRIDEAEADSSEKEEATTEFNKHTEELMELKIKEESYRTIARKHLVIDVEEVKTDEQPAAEVIDKGTVSTRSGSKSAMSFKLPQLEKFRRGENFSKFCEKFLEYVTLGNIGGDGLNNCWIDSVALIAHQRFTAELQEGTRVGHSTSLSVGQ